MPFNYVIPGQSVNDIIKIRETLSRSPALQPFLPDITDLAAVAADKKPSPLNELAGPGYRVINFVGDLPVRIDKYLCRLPDDPIFAESGCIVFVLTEFQIIDVRTAENNERGENSHDKYKERQAARVKARLMHGMKDDGLGVTETSVAADGLGFFLGLLDDAPDPLGPCDSVGHQIVQLGLFRVGAAGGEFLGQHVQVGQHVGERVVDLVRDLGGHDWRTPPYWRRPPAASRRPR